MEKNYMLKKIDLEDSAYDQLQKIKMRDFNLYCQMMSYLDEDSSNTINESCFEFIVVNLDLVVELDETINFGWYLLELAKENTTGTEWLEWSTAYFKKQYVFNPEDLLFLVNEAIKKEVPLYIFQKWAENFDEDIHSVIDKISAYTGEESVTEESNVNSDTVESVDGETEFYSSNVVVESPEKILKEQYGYSDLFNGFVSAMAGKSGKEISMTEIQNNMNQIFSKMTQATTEMNSFIYEALKNWEIDKKEIERLSNLCDMQQRLTEFQQHQNNELRKQIEELKTQIYERQKTDLETELLTKKMQEVQQLMENRNRSSSKMINTGIGYWN